MDPDNPTTQTISTHQDAQARAPAESLWKGLLHLFVVYIVWGSTYLAIRVSVRPGAGFPPFTLGTVRTLIGGCALLVWAQFTRRRLRVGSGELIVLAISGILFWPIANGLVAWAEQRADSGLAALLVAAAPIWAAFLEAYLDRRPPSWLLVAALVIGFGGIGLLSAPVFMEGVRADVLSVIALLMAGMVWATASVLQNRRKTSLSALANSGYQQIIGGFVFLLIVAAIREPEPTPIPEAWWGLGYLTVFGSILAFTSFTQALRLLPASIAMTYAYVNPVIAVILGWLILREPITGWKIAGSALILISVAVTFRERFRKKPADSPDPGNVTT